MIVWNSPPSAVQSFSIPPSILSSTTHKNQSACRRQVKWNCFSEETFDKNNADFKFTDTATSGALFHKYSVPLSTIYLDLE